MYRWQDGKSPQYPFMYKIHDFKFEHWKVKAQI